ncbi:ATP synthase F1 subunit gamma [Candidatus Margulisiibacteriota bacterium]
MSNIRELKQRIASVIKTRKMTQAMKMVAAAKFKRAVQKSQNVDGYVDELEAVLSDTANRIEPDFFPVFFCKNGSPKQVVIVITGDRGLCGGYNTSVLKAAWTYLNDQKSTNVQLYLFGNKACAFFKRKKWEIYGAYPYFMDKLGFDKVEHAIDLILERFVNGEIGIVKAFFNQFQSALTSKLVHRQYLPILLEKTAEEPLSDYIYEPSKPSVLYNYLHHYLVMLLYKDLLDSNTGEEAARMMAMEAATDNAAEMIGQLQLVYNRTRQAHITREINEIVSGVEALAG